jgi:peptidoglycan/xylan/chitin deacetylase (PgdA/CDA1 family)
MVMVMRGLLVAAMFGAVMGLAAQVPAPRAQARVALTFDDLPTHGPLPPGMTRADIATRIIEALRGHQAPPVYGFINAKSLEAHPEDAQVLRLWRDAGLPLGNHAFSHMDLHANPAEAFEQDILANEPALRTYMGDQDWHWFRYPYLREGETPETHRAVRTFLTDHGYTVAQVTLSFDDYAYNDPYARCLAQKDTNGIDWLKQSYLTRAGESLTRGQEAARTLFGHDIPHVMLLHIGGFETVMFPRLLDLLQERGFALITLQEAARDPAYAKDPDLPANWNGTWLQQWLNARHTPAAPREPANIFDTLSALCR